jgi:hypothetical protein
LARCPQRIGVLIVETDDEVKLAEHTWVSDLQGRNGSALVATAPNPGVNLLTQNNPDR